MLRSLFRRRKPVAIARKMLTAPLLVVLGATGTGKSELAVDLATRFDGEIINGDAMQMYAGLPIITNKITIEEQKGIPHHLLGCIGLDEDPWHAGTFKKNASQIIQEIRSRGKIPILVGGTHYYTQSLLFEDTLVHGSAIGTGDQSDKEISAEELKVKFPILAGPTEAILEELRHVDPIMAQRWHPNDRRKIQRSLEIFLATGKKASEIYDHQKRNRISRRKSDSCAEVSQASDAVLDSTLLFWVYSEPESLRLRLDARVDKMVESGLLDEVRTLDQYLQQQKNLEVTVDKTRGIWASIGWKEFDNYLTLLKSESPLQELDAHLEQSIEQVKAATRQYARRQVRWIRKKLMDALSDEDALGRLYLLDGSDITVWKDAVSDTAIQITERFLAGSECPIPSELSEVAKNVLAPDEAPESSDNNWVQQECELCHVIGVTENQWQDHLKSRQHRARLKRHSRNLSLREVGHLSVIIGDQEVKTKVP